MSLSRFATLAVGCTASLSLAIVVRADSSTICLGAANSAGPGASLAWSGSFQPSQGSLISAGLPQASTTLLLYSLQSAQTPFGNGTLCLGNPTWIALRTRSDGAGQLQIDLQQQAEAEDQRWLEFAWRTYGFDTWYFQLWYRDAQGGGARHNLSDAIRVSFE